jgi:hypothetical protein
VVIGYARAVEFSGNVWLMLHGKVGQASDRLYVVPSFSPEDSVCKNTHEFQRHKWASWSVVNISANSEY